MRTKLILFTLLLLLAVPVMAQESGFKQPPVAITGGMLLQDGYRPDFATAVQFNLPTVTRETDYTLTTEFSVVYSDRAPFKGSGNADLYAARLTETARKFLGGTHGYVGMSVGGWIIAENGGEDTKPWVLGIEGGFAPIDFRIAIGCDMVMLDGPDLFFPRITISRVGGL
jgi:hypothetical protein